MKKLSFIVLTFTLIIVSNYFSQIAEKAIDISPLLIGEKIPDITLLSLEGKQRSFASITAGKPSVILFYCGGWCPCCNRHLAEIATIEDRIIELGYQLIAFQYINPDYRVRISAKLLLAVLENL